MYIDEGPVRRYDGLEIEYNSEKGTMHITQTGYIETIQSLQ